MTEELGGIGGWLKGLRGKAEKAVGEKQADFARGRVAGVAVTDDAGNTLAEAGQRIDDAILARARQAGKLAALAGAVVQGQTQDLRETVQTQYAKTENAKEARLLDSVEEYRESRRYIGRILTMDVTDIRGHVVVPSGKTLDDADILRARDAGLLSALLSAAEQSLPALAGGSTPAPIPTYTPPPAPRAAPTLLNGPEEEER